ncbi:M50 family metallopeptidase [Legionella londiniensis]|uniref:Membrane associated zinc metalloprotease n=1 Tax=Legionella londiniensis TaxID=45068 RepID=A0A0W0VT35_9GAMM|nr:site-2 protease family protein [Legionella londiniensis]KTD23202.1 membrane associated zinc metalloprotease [Legionella londiniensis]STX93787.1 membrane associated zinc metalloprotease [Legionella londiniensis]
MTVVYAVLAIIISLLAVVGLHEAGHAIAARIFAVKIKRIAIGFGKPLLKKTSRRGIEWVWGLWPLGGYVLLLNSRHHAVEPKNKRFCFDKKHVWQRIIILSAGALVNILVAWFAFLFIYLIGYKTILPVSAYVRPNSIAAQAGMQQKDRFISIAGQPAESWRQVAMAFIMNLGEKDVLVEIMDPAGKKRTAYFDLTRWEYNRKNNTLFKLIGVKPDTDKKYHLKISGLPVWQAARKAFEKLYELIAFYLVLLKQLAAGVLPISVLLGPLGLFTEMIASFTQGLRMFLYFIGNLSLAVAVINLLPIPGLDGGSIFYAMIEKIRGRPMSIAMEILLHRLAIILFFVFLVQLLMNDMQRYLQ